MKKLIASIAMLALLLALLLAGCSLDAPSDPTGSVNPPGPEEIPAQFGAIGNSLTAGYMDTGLREEGQLNSIPKLIAGQMGLTDDQFTQPIIAPPGIGTTDVGEGNVASSMYFDGSTIDLVEFFPIEEVPERLLNKNQLIPYHNMGVPGAWAQDVMSAYDKASSFGAGNSYFDFINRAAVLFGNYEDSASYRTGPDTSKEVIFQTASQFRQMVAVGPRLCTLWIGGNDIYLGATSGNPNGVGGLPVTPVPAFQESFTDMVALLAGGLAARTGWDPDTQTGIQPTIVVANIPSLASIPHFIPTATFEAVIAGMGAPVPGYDEVTVDYVLLPALAWVPDNLGQDLPSRFTLTPAEVALIEGTVAGYNQVITVVAATIHGSGTAKVGMVDANALLAGLTDLQKTHFLFLLGQMFPHAPPWDATEIATAAATTYFSLDGFHPNNLGYGAIANEFIKVINALDDTSIPELDLGTLTWDPTYGVVATKSVAAPSALMTPAAGRALGSMFK